MFNPLPKELTLGESEIHDIGLFAKEDIKRGHDFGISHIQIGEELYRTPLGGFINHSELKPNCTKSMFRASKGTNYKAWRLFATDDIESGDELTLTYTFYKL
tara:strand:+ start:1745 stop:2050 length:306 start_codon:yes stop_codon:yes gene_type:complete